MADPITNFAYSTVATAPSPASSGTSLVVQAADGAKFPAAPFNVVIWPASTQPTTTNAEIARCTAKSTDTLTIVRAQEGSSARTVVVGDQIAQTMTAATVASLLPIYITSSDRIIDDASQVYVDGFYEIGSGFSTELAGTSSQLVVGTPDEGSMTSLALTGPAVYGIDFNTGIFSTGSMHLKNDSFVYGRNAANNADVQVWKFNSLNEFQVQTPMRFSGTITVSDGINFTFGTSAGTQFGIAAAQKMSFWGVTTVVQPVSTTDIDTVLINTGLKASGGKTPFSNTYVTAMDETINTDRQVVIEDYYEVGSGFVTELAGANSLLAFTPTTQPWAVSGRDASGAFVELLAAA